MTDRADEYMGRSILSRRNALAAASLGALAACAPARPAAQPAPTGASNPATLPGTQVFDLDSRAVGGAFRIYVAPPAPPPVNARWKPFEEQDGYPVLYAADANMSFAMIAQIAQLMQAGQDVTPFWVVGIGYPTEELGDIFRLRQRDMTPTRGPLPQAALAPGGGSAKFRSFIQTELKPEIARRFKPLPDRSCWVGASHGGAFGIETLFSEPDVFDAVIAIDPSNWDNSVWERSVTAYTAVNKALAKTLYVSIAYWTEDNVADETFRRMLQATAVRHEEFLADLGARGLEGLRLQVDMFRGESHFSVAPASFAKGLRLIYGLR